MIAACKNRIMIIILCAAHDLIKKIREARDLKKLLIFMSALVICLCCAGVALADATLISTLHAINEEYYTTGDTAKGDLPLASIRSVAIDAEGGMWVGTNGGGLAYKPAGSDVFTDYSLMEDTKIPLQSDVVQAVAIDSKGGIWISQAKSYVDATQNKGVAYYYNGEITYYNESVEGTIPNNYVQDIEIDSNGVVWFGSFGGLTKYNPATNEWHTYTVEDGLPAPSVDAIAFDSRGGVFYGCYPEGSGTQADPFRGGFGYVSADGTVYGWKFTADYSEEYSTSLLADVWVRDIAVDANNGAWIICSGSYGNMENKGGVVYYVDSNLNMIKRTGKELLGDRLTENSEIRCVQIDNSGTIWFGTWNGVYAYNTKNTDMRCFSAAAGSWQAPETMYDLLDNIYFLDIIGNTMYIGSNGGVCVGTIEVGAAPAKSEGVVINVADNESQYFALVDGNSVLVDPAAQVIDGVTFVPIRFVSENLGLTVNWSAENPNVVQLVGEDKTFEFNIGSQKATVNGEEISLLASPFAVDGRTMLPVRVISENMGYSVDYEIYGSEPLDMGIFIK